MVHQIRPAESFFTLVHLPFPEGALIGGGALIKKFRWKEVHLFDGGTLVRIITALLVPSRHDFLYFLKY